MTRDLRRYSKQTNVRLLIGFFVLLVLVGDGLIYLFYGQGSAIVGLICVGVALIPALLVWLVLLLMEWILKKADRG
jgi:hypothetical protein